MTVGFKVQPCGSYSLIEFTIIKITNTNTIMKRITARLVLITLGLSLLLLSSCTPQRGVRGVYEVKNGKHYKLTKGRTPSCVNAWEPQP